MDKIKKKSEYYKKELFYFTALWNIKRKKIYLFNI